MLVGTFLVIVAVMALLLQTPAAQRLFQALIEALAANLNKMSVRPGRQSRENGGWALEWAFD